jgi:hypothetical protein
MPSLGHPILRHASPWVLLLSAVVSTNCRESPEPDDGCFPVDPWKEEREAAAEYAGSDDFRPEDYDRMLRAIGFCEHEPDEIGDIFPEYPRIDIDTGVFFCTPATTCEQCVDEDVDRRIRESYASQQDEGCPADHRAILAYERGCVTESVDAEGEPTCCYSAAIVSECPFDSVPMG